MKKWGFGLSKNGVWLLIGLQLTNNIQNSFKNGISSDNLSQNKGQIVEVARKRSVDPFIINDYFSVLKSIRKSNPIRVYNIEETRFCLDPSIIEQICKKELLLIEQEIKLHSRI